MGVRNDARVRFFPLEHDTLFLTGGVDANEKADSLMQSFASSDNRFPKATASRQPAWYNSVLVQSFDRLLLN
jgi:hypothetical protein